ncbi:MULTISPECIES: transglutaminase domain-containing protein [Pedobacter]|uniref:transglutaminase domain-containing protein n=1 Tax=Pedobacter TaxID=84567 RepID=UPI0029310B9F|nr:transglutaminase domain-containing protein [Pedobacter aquatilis]
MRKIFLLLSFSFFVINAFAQNFPFGAVTFDDNNFDRNKIDSNANAVVLKEFGTSSIQISDRTGSFELIFEYHVKIKLYSKEGFKKANVVIPIYKDGTREEFLNTIKASTFNFENGRFVETEMDKKAIFTEIKSRYWASTKFTLPNIKEGSIIEYSYRLESPNLFNFKTWEFQSDIPKVYSEYLAYIPAVYNYNVSLRGFYKLSNNKSEIARECLRVNGVPIDCSKIWYVMKDVPAFVEENYMTAASNFKSAIYFELSDWQMPDGRRQIYSKTWKDVDYELTSEKTLGSQMRRKDLFKETIPTITKSATDDLSKAKAVYEYIKKQIKWNNYYGTRSEDNIKKALDMRSGNVADINLSLIAALSAANLDTEAVILSTRDNGTVNKLYPIITDFNYLVAKVNIGDKSYLLDATDPLLPFGLLPLRCVNDQGRVINLKKASYWIDLTAFQKSTSSYIMDAKLNADGKITGTITIHNTGYEALNKRKEIKKYNSIDEYVEKLDERLPKLQILKHNIINIDSVEKTLTEIYQIDFSPMGSLGNDELNFSPFFINPIVKNPFNLNERTYPVDLGAASEERIIISIALPGKFDVKEKPKDLAIALPNSGGRYLLKTNIDDNLVTFSQILQLNKAIYQAEEYPYLKEFYSKIIQNQKSDLLLKKVK